MPECSFVAKDATMEGAMMKSKDHATKAHPEKMKKMMESMSEAQMMEAMKKAVKNG